ncbi:MAG: hypothetical protein ACFFAN_11950 [Promethearchaeota archaeon]
MDGFIKEKLKLKQFQAFDKIMLLWVGICLVFWLFFIIIFEFIFQFLYFFVWILCFGTFFWINKDFIKEKLRSWKVNSFFKFLIIGVGMVLLEEIFAALFNHLSEGFSFNLFLLRILQFWLFNVIVFTPWFIIWFILLKKFKYSVREVFYLAGICGLIFESIFFLLFLNPLGFLFITPLVIFTYGILIFPSVMGLEEECLSKKKINIFLKYVLSIIAPVLCSILISGIIIGTFRPIYPELFPPEKFGFSYQ